jgi:hypothetical protein
VRQCVCVCVCMDVSEGCETFLCEFNIVMVAPKSCWHNLDVLACDVKFHLCSIDMLITIWCNDGYYVVSVNVQALTVLSSMWVV